MAPQGHESFAAAVQRPEEVIDLARAALAIAQEEYPDLDIEAYVAKIDGLGSSVRNRCGSEADPYRTLATLNYVLFRQEGFRGDSDDYYNPKNSFLNDVIERRKGIPIALSVLYMEVARRVGLSLDGVGFPGHFLVRYRADEEILIDPFNGGEIRSIEELKALLNQAYKGNVPFRRELLAPIGKKQIVKRMLNNLKLIYLQRDELVKCISVVERLLILEPGSAQEIRDRGHIYLKLECFPQAAEDLEAYLKLVPTAEDADEIRKELATIKKRVGLLH